MRYWLALYLMIWVAGLNAEQIISGLAFRANFEISEQELSQQSGMFSGEIYEPEKVELARQRLREYFSQKGDYYVLVQKPELIPVDATQLKLIFQLQRLLDADEIYLKFTGLKYFSESSLHRLLYTRAEATYPLKDLALCCSRVAELYQERGYLFALVEPDSLVIEDSEENGRKLVAYIKVEENQPFRAEHYYFKGNKTTRESSILKKSGLVGQTPITPQKLKKAEQNLKSAAYIKDCRILPLDEKSLFIEITEDRMTFLEGVLGLMRQNDKTRLSGLVNIDFQNLWGTDRGINLFWRNTPEQLSELRLSYHDSGHPAWPIEGDFTGYRANQDTLWIQSKMGTDIYYRSLYQKLGLSFLQNKVWPATVYSAFERDGSTRLGAFWSYQNTMGHGIPTSGFSWDMAYYYLMAKGGKNSAVEAGSSYYQPISNRLISHLALNLKAYKKPELPEYDLYRLGGFKSLRGYLEDEFKAGRIGWMNLELRLMLDSRSMLYIFWDQGLLYGQNGRYRADLFAFGGGLGLGTRIGVLNIGYGLPYRDKAFSSPALGVVHIGLDLAL